MDQILQWLAHGATFWAYLVLLCAALLEYVFPPFPGDAITLFGVFLTITAGYHGPTVFLAITAGSILGSFLAYGFGRRLAGTVEHERPRILRGPRATRALAAIAARFERHGAAYLVVNRFVPALRALVFVAAGIARIPAWKVLVYGGTSAMLWNGALFAAGWAAGRSWERLQEMSTQYAIAATAVVVGVVLVLVVRRLVLRRAQRVAGKAAAPEDVG